MSKDGESSGWSGFYILSEVFGFGQNYGFSLTQVKN
jgi:hypothetical protein